MTEDNLAQALETEAQRIEEDSEYSAKRHFNSCDLWSWTHYLLGGPAALLAACATTAIVKNHAESAQLLALAATLFSGLLTFLKPNDRAAQHRTVGNQYLSLRNDSRMFREIDLHESIDEGKKSERLRRLAQRRNDLNSTAPTTPGWAFRKAREGIEQGEATYKVDLHK
jgi:hypothetical protein